MSEGAKARRIDAADNNSVAVSGDTLARLFWSSPGGDAVVALYDRGGVIRSCRLERDGDAHHVAFDVDNLIVTSTSTNSILMLSRDLHLLSRWCAPGAGDAWHINGVHVAEERLVASAFGRFSSHREWVGKLRGSGVVFDLRSGENILTGLSAPHHPQLRDGLWHICNSADYSFLVLDAASPKVLVTVELGGWTRGLVITDHLIYVGVSAPRHEQHLSLDHAEIAVICRKSYGVLDRIAIPAREIVDLCLVDPSLVESLARNSGAASLCPSEPFPDQKYSSDS